MSEKYTSALPYKEGDVTLKGSSGKRNQPYMCVRYDSGIGKKKRLQLAFPVCCIG